MSKKNSIVLSHKSCFENFEHISNIYSDFKNKIKKFKTSYFLVGVSGGPDSMALAALCKAYSHENKKKKFLFVNVNHGIRKNSFKESNLVKTILKKQKINLKILNNNKKIVKNIQHNARKIRYNLFLRECKRQKIKFILTAHHSEDQIETFLIRLSRGSGVKGLSSMRSTTLIDKKIKIFRPFLQTKKSDLVLLTKKVFGKFINDPSNKNDKFLRVKIRKLLPILNQHGIHKNQILKSIQNLQLSNNSINFYFNDIFDKIIIKKKNRIIIKKSELFSLNKELQFKILGKVIKNVSGSDYPPRSKKILKALEMLQIDNKEKYSLGKCLFIKNFSSILVEKEDKN